MDWPTLERVLVRQIGLPLHAEGCPCTGAGQKESDWCLSAGNIGERFGFSKRTVERWRATGRIARGPADRIATDLGLHLDLIWDAA